MAEDKKSPTFEDVNTEEGSEVLGVVEEQVYPATARKDAERVLKIAAVVPFQAVAGKKGVGRPRKIEKTPTPDDLVYHAVMTEAQTKFVAEDSLVKAIEQRKDSLETLLLVKGKLAQINSALEFDATEMGKFGRKDVATVRSKQVQALNAISQIEMEMQKRGSTAIDLKGEQFQKIFKLWVGMIREIVKEIFTPEQANMFFNRLESEFAGWEEKASDVLR